MNRPTCTRRGRHGLPKVPAPASGPAPAPADPDPAFPEALCEVAARGATRLTDRLPDSLLAAAIRGSSAPSKNCRAP